MNNASVTADHRERQAYVYVRQSSMAQVRENTESLERQYELSHRAVELGWEPGRVVICRRRSRPLRCGVNGPRGVQVARRRGRPR
jgi:hypothetical protein